MKKTNPLSVKDIENIAKKFRTYFNIDKNSYFPILEVIDNLFENNLLSYQIVEDDYYLLDENTLAMYNASENFIYIKESVIDEYEQNIYRSCFTLCHELFHYIQNEVLGFKFEYCEKCKNYEDPEWQANEFAGQILIPSEYVDLPEDEIMEKYHVSIECALTRKANVKKRQKKIG